MFGSAAFGTITTAGRVRGRLTHDVTNDGEHIGVGRGVVAVHAHLGDDPRGLRRCRRARGEQRGEQARGGQSLDSWLMEAQEMFFLNFDWEMMTYRAPALIRYVPSRVHAPSESAVPTDNPIPARITPVIRFGPFQIDPRTWTLTRDRQPVDLSPRRGDLSRMRHRCGRQLGVWITGALTPVAH